MSQTLETPPVEESLEPWRGRPAPPSAVGDYMPFGETRAAQRLAHPLRSFGRALPWWTVPSLVPDRSAVLWAARRKIDR